MRIVILSCMRTFNNLLCKRELSFKGTELNVLLVNEPPGFSCHTPQSSLRKKKSFLFLFLALLLAVCSVTYPKGVKATLLWGGIGEGGIHL